MERFSLRLSALLTAVVALCGPCVFGAPTQKAQPSKESHLAMLSVLLSDGPSSPRYEGRMAFLTQGGLKPALAAKVIDLMNSINLANKDILRQFPDRKGTNNQQYVARRDEKIRVLYDEFTRRLDLEEVRAFEDFLRRHAEQSVR